MSKREEVMGVAFIPGMTKKGFKVHCSNCEKDFKLTKSELKTRRLKGEMYEGLALYEVYYNCKECNHKYIVCKIDSYLKNDLGPKMKQFDDVNFLILQRKYKKRLDLINKRA